MRRKRLRLISLLLAMMLLLSTAIPITSAFAADYDMKYHPDDWFGYTHSKEEIESWIKDAVKYPTTSEEAIEVLTGEIRPGDVISFQVEIEMPTGHEEIIQFLKDFSFNMTFPFGVNTMIEVYASDAPLLTDEEYDYRLACFKESIEDLEDGLNDKTILEAIENGEISESEYIMYSDMVENKDKYLNIYQNQLEIAKSKWGLAVGTLDTPYPSYGSVENWSGACQDNPNTTLGENDTYQSWRDNLLKNSYVAPQITPEEFEQVVSEFDEQYPLLVEEFKAYYEEAKEDYEQGQITESDLDMIIAEMESINDGTFYDTIIKYFEDCRDGYYNSEKIIEARFFDLDLTGQDYYNAYFGTYTYKFPDNIVQQNKPIKYLFDINIVATDALSVGSYFSIPSLHWYYKENCPTQYYVSEGFLKGHWEQYRSCNSHSPSIFNFGNTYFCNNIDFDINNIEYKVNSDKRMLAWEYISNNYGDSEYANKFKYEYFEEIFINNTLKTKRPLTIEYRDEKGNIIKTEVNVTDDAYYNVLPKNVYDYQLVGPEFIKGVIENKDTTVTFFYEHKDAQITVSYVDSEGNKLAPAEMISGKTLDEYKTEPANIYGYELVAIPENASGVLHEDSADVQYVYELKNSSVTVNYLDENGNKLADSETISGNVFDEYSTESKDFYGYILLSNPENSNGMISEEETTVDYIYRKIFDELPDEPYKAVYGDKLSDIELPFGWEFADALPDDTVGNVGSNTFNVIVPADDTHEEIRGTITIDVYPSYWVNGVDYDKLPTDPYEATYGDLLSSIELPKGWEFVNSDVNETVGDVGTNTFVVFVPGDGNHYGFQGLIKVNVSPAKWVEGIDYDKLPTDPYEATYGDLLSSIELPKGWIFADSAEDTTVGDVGTNTFVVIVPSDKNHYGFQGEIKVNVSPAKWVEGIDYDKLPTDPYEAIYGDLLSSIELPKGWVFVNSDEATVGEIGTNTFNVIVPADKNHSEIKGTVTILVSEKAVIEDPIVPNPDDNKPDENEPSVPIEDKPEEILPSEPVEEKPTEPIISEIPDDEKPADIAAAESEEQQEKAVITPDTGSNEILIPVALITVGAAAALSLIICRKRKSAVQ